MLILDTNVVSAFMYPKVPPEVAVWLDRQAEDHLFTTTISLAETFAGLAVMASGRRQQELEAAAVQLFAQFGPRILPFDAPAARAYAGLYALRRRIGRPTSSTDLMVAAIAHAHSATVVTRNLRDFEGCDLPVVNPWQP